MRLQIRSS